MNAVGDVADGHLAGAAILQAVQESWPCERVRVAFIAGFLLARATTRKLTLLSGVMQDGISGGSIGTLTSSCTGMVSVARMASVTVAYLRLSIKTS